MKRTNLLLIMADQWRLDGLGAVGGWAQTPNLDALAGEGTLFDNCLTNSPICIPARLSFATGLYPHNTGVWNNVKHDMAADTDTWMQAIQRAGYHTYIVGKSHWHRHEGDLRDRLHLMHAYGFDDVDEIPGPKRCTDTKSNMTDAWEQLGLLNDYKKDFADRHATKAHVARPSVLPLEQYTDVYVGQQAKTYLQQYDDEKPWFCMVSFGGPHEPWDTPEPYASMYDPQSMPKPIQRPSNYGMGPKGHMHRRFEASNSQQPALTDEDIALLRANYAGNLTLIDEQLGQIFQVLKDRGEWDNTAVVFVSDHGEMNGDHGLLYKGNFLNSAVKVPLIVRLPKSDEAAPIGNRYSGMVEWFDVGPTLCEIAGAQLQPRRSQQFGKSLVSVLHDPGQVHREEALCEIHGELMIQNQEWKIAVNKDGIPYMLFNLKDDPDEQNNLAGKPEAAEISGQLTARLLQRIVTSQTSVISKKAK
jgi:arylsulfatase